MTYWLHFDLERHQSYDRFEMSNPSRETESVQYRALDLKWGYMLVEAPELYQLLAQREQRTEAEVVQKLARFQPVHAEQLALTGEAYDLQQSDVTRPDRWESIDVVHRLPDLVFEVPPTSEVFSGFMESYTFLLTQGDAQLAIQVRVPCNSYDSSAPLVDQAFDLPMVEAVLHDESVGMGLWIELKQMRDVFLGELRIWLADQINSVMP